MKKFSLEAFSFDTVLVVNKTQSSIEGLFGESPKSVDIKIHETLSAELKYFEKKEKAYVIFSKNIKLNNIEHSFLNIDILQNLLKICENSNIALDKLGSPEIANSYNLKQMTDLGNTVVTKYPFGSLNFFVKNNTIQLDTSKMLDYETQISKIVKTTPEQAGWTENNVKEILTNILHVIKNSVEIFDKLGKNIEQPLNEINQHNGPIKLLIYQNQKESLEEAKFVVDIVINIAQTCMFIIQNQFAKGLS